MGTSARWDVMPISSDAIMASEYFLLYFLVYFVMMTIQSIFMGPSVRWDVIPVNLDAIMASEYFDSCFGICLVIIIQTIYMENNAR